MSGRHDPCMSIDARWRPAAGHTCYLAIALCSTPAAGVFGVEFLTGRPSSRQVQNFTAHRAGQKRRLLAAAPEDFSPFAKNTGATFWHARAPWHLACSRQPALAIGQGRGDDYPMPPDQCSRQAPALPAPFRLSRFRLVAPHFWSFSAHKVRSSRNSPHSALRTMPAKYPPAPLVKCKRSFDALV